MEEFIQKLHRDLKLTTLWGYNRQFPKPTIDCNQGELVRVKWENNLHDKHMIPVDTSIFHGDHIPNLGSPTFRP
ncbi:multicopper oxidase domain-containing protein [Ferdinandcohnia quinoae]|uniref:Multicopper oxidase domain-containing protein n=1 Tax=Fredinandcohnia quinoae TaxID=2918902 RepID=A0AAW5DVA5_9BACI|nr:multicopper oxidase domain-containing protein [Fredinandcohnia sp. SECRCQ15]MCH1624572.1 multicopper oxidase domain-containing protein [Fredinandcohnia sp. SECRCQ15]